MADIAFWINALKPQVLDFFISEPALPLVSAIRFVRHMLSPAKNEIYIGFPEEIREAIKREDIKGITFFSSGGGAELIELAEKHKANVVISALDILDIHELLSNVMRQYLSWEIEFFKAVNRRNGIHDIVNAAAEISGMQLILINSRFRVVFRSKQFRINDPIEEEIFKNNLLQKETAEELLGVGWEMNKGPDFVMRHLDSGNICWVRRVVKDKQIISTMLLLGPGNRSDFDAATLLELTQKSISKIMEMPGSTGYWTEIDFKVLLDDIISQRLTDEYEINKRFSLLEKTPQKYCTFIIIDFDSSIETLQSSVHIFTQLEEIFPDSNAAIYEGSLVLLLSRSDRVFQPTPIFDSKLFTSLLTRHDAFASVGNATSRRSRLRTNYLIAKTTLQLGKALRQSQKERIFLFEDYAEYIMIDLCIKSFSDLMGHDDLIYLTHPDAITVKRYDLDNQTNLMDVLYYYCMNNCNIVKTGKAAYMHRNTVTNKLMKINELIKSDLNDAQTRLRIILSYKILRYYEKNSKIDIKERINSPLRDE